MRTLIVTGISGFIGGHLLLELSKKYNLRCLVRKNSDRIDMPNIEYLVMDFMNPVFEKLCFKNVCAVVHLLSIKQSGNSNILAINVEFTKRLVQASQRNKIRKFIYMSSETVQLPGNDKYTCSKKLAEIEVRKHENHLILRPTVVYGKKDDSNIGLLIKLARYLRVIPVIGSGQKLIQPVEVTNIVACLDAGLARNISGTYLIAGHAPVKYKELIATIAESIEKRILIIHIPISLSYLIAGCLELLGLSILQKSQIDNLKIDRAYSMDKTEKLFRVNFSSPYEGLRRVLDD